MFEDSVKQGTQQVSPTESQCEHCLRMSVDTHVSQGVMHDPMTRHTNTCVVQGIHEGM